MASPVNYPPEVLALIQEAAQHMIPAGGAGSRAYRQMNANLPESERTEDGAPNPLIRTAVTKVDAPRQ